MAFKMKGFDPGEGTGMSNDLNAKKGSKLKQLTKKGQQLAEGRSGKKDTASTTGLPDPNWNKDARDRNPKEYTPQSTQKFVDKDELVKKAVKARKAGKGAAAAASKSPTKFGPYSLAKSLTGKILKNKDKAKTKLKGVLKGAKEGFKNTKRAKSAFEHPMVTAARTGTNVILGGIKGYKNAKDKESPKKMMAEEQKYKKRQSRHRSEKASDRLLRDDAAKQVRKIYKGKDPNKSVSQYKDKYGV